MSYKITHRPALKDETDSHSLRQCLTPTKRELTVSLNTSFFRLKGRHTKRIGRNLDVQFECIADTHIEANQATQRLETLPLFSSRALLKYSPLTNFKTYFGLQYSEDGLTSIFGAKIAGIKILVPWANMHRQVLP